MGLIVVRHTAWVTQGTLVGCQQVLLPPNHASITRTYCATPKGSRTLANRRPYDQLSVPRRTTVGSWGATRRFNTHHVHRPNDTDLTTSAYNNTHTRISVDALMSTSMTGTASRATLGTYTFQHINSMHKGWFCQAGNRPVVVPCHQHHTRAARLVRLCIRNVPGRMVASVAAANVSAIAMRVEVVTASTHTMVQ